QLEPSYQSRTIYESHEHQFTISPIIIHVQHFIFQPRQRRIQCHEKKHLVLEEKNKVLEAER
ncbi:hypothetical protein PMAYCL1PPCAC_20304, partial [Pristionchus mayeri]